MKICSKCSKIKPEDEYSKSKRGHNGLRSNCKSCDRLRCKEWKDKNPEKIKATNLRREKGRKQNPKTEMLRRAEKRSKSKGIKFSITEDDIDIPQICPILRKPLVFSNSKSINRFAPSLDRIYIEDGYTPENVAVISYKANTMKSDASIEELQLFALWVLENFPLNSDSIQRIKEVNARIH